MVSLHGAILEEDHVLFEETGDTGTPFCLRVSSSLSISQQIATFYCSATLT